MPKTVVLDSSDERVDLWATTNPEEVHITVSYRLSGGGVAMNKAVDMTPSLTAAQRTAIVSFTKALIDAAKAKEGM